MLTQGRQPKPEFSRLMPVERLGEAEAREEIAATPEERAAVARRFDLRALDELRAVVRVRREGKDLIRVRGRFTADLVQTCVVSLEPVRNRLEESFTQLYTLAPAAAAVREAVVEPDEEEPPEAVGPSGIDLGEAVAQQLAVALDPYPRAPGAKLSQAALGERGEAGDDGGPFAALKALKGRG
ncbi:MAG: DUF177 domain-containing protein [Kiloniellaceae bacterium]